MPPTDLGRRPAGGMPRTAAVASLAAVLTYAVGSGIASALQPTGYAADQQSVTDLLADGVPFRWVAVGTFVLSGLMVVLAAIALPVARSRRGVLAVGGAAVTVLGLLPRDSMAVVEAPLLGCALVALLSLACWPVAGRRAREGDRIRAGVLLALVAGLGLAAVGDLGYGAYERVLAVALLGHVALAALHAWWVAGHRLGSRPVRMAVAAVVLGAAGMVGGIVTTVVMPAHVSMQYVDIRLALSPSPSDLGRVVVPTVLGDLEAGFAGIAPGVRAFPQVKADVVTSIGSGDASLETLRPSPAELDRAIRDAAIGLGFRVGVGALVVIGLAIALRAASYSRRPRLGTALVAVTALVLALGTIAGTVAQTYRSGTPREFKASGLLGTIQQNSRVFDDVAVRSEQVAPYLRNVVALSEALRERYEPQPIGGESVLRLLLVSDIHAGNQYPLLQNLIETEQIDAVIDCGDLVNFGTVTEGEFAGVFEGIGSLGVPYVFVRGNHDATSAADDAVLRRLDRIPNVVLLQPDSTRYEEFTIAGVRIAGFNDPRWFGDDGHGSADKQAPARARWLASFAGREMPDVVVSHEPWAVQGVTGAGVLLNGHMHTAFREGNRVQAGTFTGGGPFSHYITGEAGEELRGQPSAFDVLDFGSACRVTALTRYRFSGVVEGRPAFDDVVLVNGASIDPREADPARVCSADLSANISAVPAAG
ncbi:MAG: metallophosphoesterase [Actinobacteria bacterium]|nr:metallophosphoesterase [Actinomycetota bacterium]